MTPERNVLVVGVDTTFIKSVASALDHTDYSMTFANAESVLSGKSINRQGTAFEVVILWSCVNGGCEYLLARILQRMPGVPVVVISPEADKQQAVKLISAGASDYLVYPVNSAVLRARVDQLQGPGSVDGMHAYAPSTRHTTQLARRASVTNAAILISGESGTGKEVLARYVHQSSGRSAGAFVAVNCAAIPETMLESILFGHEKGSFTGAVARYAGKFEQASGGTLFLDEVAEMPLEQQAKLLRALQEKEIERLGGSGPIKVDVRIVSASNRDLAQCVREGSFREDLFYRLNVFPLHLNPLRERQEDILPLAQFFLRRSCGQSGQPTPELSPEAARALKNHDWPGNIRELENTIQRACVLKRSWVILPDDLMLPGYIAQQQISVVNAATGNVIELNGCSQDCSQERSDIGNFPGPARKQQEWRHVLEILQRNKGHRSRSAEELGMTTRMLRYKLAQLRDSGIDVDSIITGSAVAS